MAISVWVIVFAASLFILIRSSDLFTESAEQIGLALGIPDFVVGVTIVAIGTSLPEIISSVFAVLNESSEIVIGNVVGSNITNIFLIVGITAVFAGKLKITYELVHIDLPLLMGSAFLLVVTVWDGRFTLFEALLCLAGFIVYILHAATSSKKESGKARVRVRKPTSRKPLTLKPFIVLVLSAASIYLGGRYTVEAVVNLSLLLNIGKEIIAASAVAFATSLPELIVCITAAKQGRPEIAIGNVLGSNVFNALAVMGVPALLGRLIIPQNILMFGLPIMAIASLLFFFMTQDKEITQWEGWLLIIFYLFFLGGLFGIR